MIVRRVLGALLLAGALLPAHRLLDPARTGLAGRATRAALEPTWEAGVLGTVLVAVVAVLLARLHDPAGLRTHGSGLARRFAAVPPTRWAATLGALTTLLAAAAALLLFDRLPTSVDEMVQLLHARALAAGRATLPLPGPAAAWMVQNGILAGDGWASVYPPGHTLLLSLGLSAGAEWLVGPLAAGCAAFFTALGLDRLLAADRGVARVASLAVALSPFLLLLGGTELSHTSAAALTGVVFWASLRARDGHAGWSLLVGAAVGGLVCIRPWTGLVLGTVLPLAAWLPPWPRPPGAGLGGGPRESGKRPGVRALGMRMAGVLAGGLPFAAVLLSWNARLYRHPLRLGYTVAFGPAHGLGFHPDPWGNAYGPLEALAYTGSDLILLGAHLLETPAPALAAVALALLLTPRLLPGAGLLLAWGVAAVAANALYWHHGIHLGPRLLYEAAPAWAALTVVAVAALLRVEPLPRWRAAATWAVLLTVVGAVALLPGRLASVARGAASTAGVPTPPAPAGDALVLVHGSWSSRVAARLAAAGMRRDSVETLLRRNDLCLAHAYADWRGGGAAPPTWPALTPRPGSPRRLRPVEISPGNRPLLDPDRPLTADCSRELRADAAAGTVELEPLLWRAPPLAGRRTWVARDLGPTANGALLARHPGRTAWLLVAGAGSGPPRLLPYAEGMARIWDVRDGG